MVTICEENRYPYDDAQVLDDRTLEALLRDLCNHVSPLDCEEGQSLLPVVARCVNVYRGMSCASVAGHLDDPALVPLLKSLVEESAKSVAAFETHFALDDVLFGHMAYDPRYPGPVRCQLVCGVRTGIVVTAEVSGFNVRRDRFLPGLLRTTTENFPGAWELTAGKVYLSMANFAAAAELGVELYIPFKVNSASGRPGQSQAWDEALRLYRQDCGEFARHYRNHSVIEDVMDTIDERTGVCIHGKTEAAQFNEALLKLFIHNLYIAAHYFVVNV